MSEQEGKNENVTKATAKEDKKTSLAREIWEWVYTLARLDRKSTRLNSSH